MFLVATPIFEGQTLAGVLAVVLGSGEFTQVVNDHAGLGQTGETLVCARDGEDVVVVAPTRHDPGLAFKLRVSAGSGLMLPLQQAAFGSIGLGAMVDYRSTQTLAAWRYLPSLDGGMVVKIDRDEALAPVDHQRSVFFLLLGLTASGVVAAAFAVSRSIARPITVLTGVARTIQHQIRQPDFVLDPVTADDELGVLHDSFNQMGLQLRQSFQKLEEANAHLEQRVADRTAELRQASEHIAELNRQLSQDNLRMSAELAITHRLQQMILPREHELERIAGLDIAGFMEPASEVGGDYYDVLFHDGRLVIGIGDVTGHGLESGVLMLMAQMAVRTLIAINETDNVKFFTALNRAIHDNVRRMNSDRNLTLSLLEYRDGVLSLSGQHEEILVARASGPIERIDTVDLGFPIGLVGDISGFIAQAQIHLQPGDVLVLYTDGITEAENPSGQLYGIARLCDSLAAHRHLAARELREAIIADLRRHIGTQKVYDDITLLVLKQR